MRRYGSLTLSIVAAASLAFLTACGGSNWDDAEDPEQPPVEQPEDPATEDPVQELDLEITTPSEADVNEEVPFEFKVVGVPSSIEKVRFEWNFGDGNANSTGQEEVDTIDGEAVLNLEHAYAAAGPYGVWISVFDGNDELVGRSILISVGGQIQVEEDYELDVCDVWEAADSGGYGYTAHNWDIKDIPAGATFDIRFDAFTLPDRYIIEYPGGKQVYETGWRGSSAYDGSPVYPGGIAGPGAGQKDDIFVKGSVDQFKVIVVGGEPGTIWEYQVRCRM